MFELTSVSADREDVSLFTFGLVSVCVISCISCFFFFSDGRFAVTKDHVRFERKSWFFFLKMWFPLSLDLLSHNQFFLTPVILILRFVPQLKWKPRPHLSVFVCKRLSFSSRLAYRPQVSGENGHRKRIFFQKRSPRWRFLQTLASRLRVDGRKRRFSTTIMSYITFACSRLRDSRVCEHAKKTYKL